MSYAGCINADEYSIYIGNDLPVRLQTLRANDSSSAVTDAVVGVSATLLDGATDTGTPVAGVTWPQVMVYESDTDSYYGVIQSEAQWVEGERYRLSISASTPGGSDARFVRDMLAAVRFG